MTDTNTVSILAGLSSVVNIILIALIVFLIAMWVRTKKKN